MGKGTLIRRLFDSHPETFTLSVSHTTRKPRPGEAHGVDYFYVSVTEFEDLIAADGFVEHAQFGSNRYGTSKATIEEQTAKGKVVVLDIEMEVRTVTSAPLISSPNTWGHPFFHVAPEEQNTRKTGVKRCYLYPAQESIQANI